MSLSSVESLIAYYKFDETSGTVAADSHSSFLYGVRDGQLGYLGSSPTLNVAGKFNTSFSFSGTSSVYLFRAKKDMDLPSYTSSNTSSYTFSLWLNLNSLPVSGEKYFYCHGKDSTRYVEAGVNSDGNVIFRIYDRGSPGYVPVVVGDIVSDSVISTGVWTHVVLQFGYGGMKVYINNVLQSDTAVTDSLGFTYTWVSNGEYVDGLDGTQDQVFIGDFTGDSIDGSVDEVCSFFSTLDASDVSALYNNGDGLMYSEFPDPGFVWQGSGTVGDPFQVTTVEELQLINDSANTRSAHYVLMNDLDFKSAASYTNPNNMDSFISGVGFSPIGFSGFGNSFTGSFDGNGKYIANLFMNRPSTECGLFGRTSSSSVFKDVVLLNIDITGGTRSAGLCSMLEGEATGCFVSGKIFSNSDFVAGLVGRIQGGSVANCGVDIDISGGAWWSGGLIGMVAGGPSPSVVNSYAVGSIVCHTGAGGLIGEVFTDAFTTALVDKCYAAVSLSTSTGNVGGLIETVSGTNETVTNCFWDEEVSGTSVSVGGTGRTTAQMKNVTTYSNSSWDIATVSGHTTQLWIIDGGNDYPVFASLYDVLYTFSYQLSSESYVYLDIIDGDLSVSSVSGITHDRATVNISAESVFGEFDVLVEYRVKGVESFYMSDPIFVTANGSYSVDLLGLDQGTLYEVRLRYIGKYSDYVEFSTDSVFSSFSVSNVSGWLYSLSGEVSYHVASVETGFIYAVNREPSLSDNRTVVLASSPFSTELDFSELSGGSFVVMCKAYVVFEDNTVAYSSIVSVPVINDDSIENIYVHDPTFKIDIGEFGVSSTVLNTMDPDPEDENIVSDASITRVATSAISSFVIRVDNTNGDNLDRFRSGQYVDFYLDYADSRLRLDYHSDLQFYFDDVNGEIVNRVVR